MQIFVKTVKTTVTWINMQIFVKTVRTMATWISMQIFVKIIKTLVTCKSLSRPLQNNCDLDQYADLCQHSQTNGDLEQHAEGFNNVRIKKGDKWKAAFWTNRGLYKPLVMFFGLTNSPATFQTMMDDIFEDLISEGEVVVYLDDVLIFMETLEEHQKITRHVLELLEKHKLYLCPDKCELEKTTIEYLGVIISHNSVAMDPVKITGVTN